MATTLNTTKKLLALILVAVAAGVTATTATARDTLARAPRVGFLAPAQAGVVGSAVRSPRLFVTVSFVAVDAGDGVAQWMLQRHVAKATDGQCTVSYRVDRTTTGAQGGRFKLRQELATGRCYYWTLEAADPAGNAATATSATVRTAAIS